MYKDALATFASAQSTTTSVAHTDVIDTLAAGQAYVGDWFVFQVSTAFTATETSGQPTVEVQLQTSDNESFANGGTSTYTMVQSATFVASQLSAGKMWAVRIPNNALRYLRAYNKVTSTAGTKVFSAGAWNSFITPDIDLDINKRYML